MSALGKGRQSLITGCLFVLVSLRQTLPNCLVVCSFKYIQRPEVAF